MKKVYIGIDAHKETNLMASAFTGRNKPEAIGKYSADLDQFLTGLRKFQKKHDLGKGDIALCYEAGPTGFVLARRLIKLGYDCMGGGTKGGTTFHFKATVLDGRHM